MDKLRKIDQTIHAFYGEKAVISEKLNEAVLYSINAGGKRIRPILFLEVIEALQIPLTESHFKAAAALEMIHTGSLIHDDLPAMDNDDYRRGQLTNHKKFDEATAILAGDSLFLDAFGMLAETDFPADVTVDLVRSLSSASGTFGMVGGQMLDMVAEGKKLNLKDLQLIHRHKTGQLLAYPFWAAARVAQLDEKLLATFLEIGMIIGLAFQVRDDILDITANFEEIGKTPKKDVMAEKMTYPHLLGLNASYQILDESLDQAEAILRKLSDEIAFAPQKILSLIERLRLDA